MGKPHDASADSFTSFHAADKTTGEPLIRVMALHALAYCERLFYLEEVEELRRADANVYDGRRLHTELEKDEEPYTLELASETLGLKGKLDCLKHRSSGWVVVEHKKGKSQKGAPWPSDRLQVMAYALLLAEHTGQEVKEAVIHYHADNQKVKIPIQPQTAGEEVKAAVARARELKASLERPPVAVPEKLCRTCSLSPVCLPEEERFALAEKPKPQRLFPPDDDRRVVHIVEQGATVGREGEQLVIGRPDGSKKPLPGINILALVLHGNVQVSTQAIHYCAANEIGLHWLSYGGHYIGAFAAGAGKVQRRHRQHQAFADHHLKVRLACRLVAAKVENQLRYVMRTIRSQPGLETEMVIQTGLNQFRDTLKEVNRQETVTADGPDFDATAVIERIRGYEGLSGRAYFEILPFILKTSAEDFLAFSGRNRRPPKDPVNALLSFGYALLYRDCVGALLAVGLEPALGFFHTPRSPAYPLALDLMELFRLLLWDIPLIGSINRRQWQKSDFEITPGQVWLNTEGRRKAIQLYESRKQEKWKHPVLNYSLSYARTIELEARLLEKEWTGQPGLFARLRLR
ncbi:MAG: type I-MYXAN CRISPR-associated endonuclease Cas1 [Deltaproteobacteria bacterium]|nr:type I-MYXAN CRISPR-associated endonuclease Cas1 [Deltaproteobacteria bacterium]MBW1987657.1 type I-MYXAN CRISPR-associated endonuclease Cas1 [Deltaproteobacteria bacterium]MBW2135682.1 type I-MYXAN CRISPR-associated endonuclease Cas1 [Deltaproteobacteria bacterium]